MTLNLSPKESKHVICRACHVQCGLIVNFEDGQPVSSHGDKNNPAYFGYSCLKGRELFKFHNSSSRLLSSLKRQTDGSFEPISWEDAARESALKIKDIVDAHGPHSVAMFVGTFGYNNFDSQAFAKAFLDGIGSKMFSTAVTIDQPGKIVGGAEHGTWIAGQQRIIDWDGLLMVGTNPLISMNGGLTVNPGRNLHEAKKRGMELIVIDPRRTESAARADLHLQARPGEDTAILGAIVRKLIADGSYDHDFVSGETEGLEILKHAVEPFTIDAAAARSGVGAEDILTAVSMVSKWNRGHFCAGTGANMSGFGSIVEYLCLTLSSLKGFWRRAGEFQSNEGVFINPPPPLAAASGAYSATVEHPMRIRNLKETLAGMPTAALAEEILMPGKGQIKALIVLGGNPVLAWPDQIKTVAAMKELDLLICVDPRMSKTAQFADYIIAPKLHYEKMATTALNEMVGVFGAGWGYDETYGQVCEPIMDVPEGSDLCEEYAFFHKMAQTLDMKLNIHSFAHAMDPIKQAEEAQTVEPDQEVDAMQAWRLILHGSPVPIDDAFLDPEMLVGKVKPSNGIEVQPKPEGWEAKLVIGSPFMMDELQRYKTDNLQIPYGTEKFPFRLINRRLNDIHNSNWQEIPSLRKRLPHHPAYLNPQDMKMLGMTDGDILEITSEIASIRCVAYTEDGILRNCVSVPHCWGTTPDESDDPLGAGGNTGRLSTTEKNYDKISGIPIMSAIPVKLKSCSA